MSKKISNDIRKGLLQSRMSERKVDKAIKKMNKSEKKLLLEVKELLDSNNEEEARLLVKELVQSRSHIKNLVKLKFYARGIEFFFKNAQTQLIKGEAMDDIARVLTKVNRLLSMDDLNQTFFAIEQESEELNLNLEQAAESLSSLDDPIDEDEEVDQIISELSATSHEQIIPKINELVDINKLIPSVPKFDRELSDSDDDDFATLEDE